MSRLLMYGIKQQKRKVSLGFEPYVAPSGFDRSAQDVDIYSIFNTYYNSNKKARFIYSIDDSITTFTFSGGRGYRYGYTTGGVDYVIDTPTTTISETFTNGNRTNLPVVSTVGFPTSGTVQYIAYNNLPRNFVYTSVTPTTFEGISQSCVLSYIGSSVFNNPTITWTGTKRWVISEYSDDSTSIIAGSPLGAVWIYCGLYVHGIIDLPGNTSKLKYIHINSLDQITSIPNSSFLRLSQLTGEVHISNNVTTIGTNAFQLCPLITSIIWGSSVNSIGYNAFYNCVGITSLGTFPEGLLTIGDNAFVSSTNANGSVVIPNSVTSIGNGAFANCKKLDSLTLGTGLTSIGISAFNGCTELSGIFTIPTTTSPLSIGYLAFFDCTGYTAQPLTIPSTVTAIGYGAFANMNFNAIVSNSSNFIVDNEGGTSCDILYDITGGSKYEANYSAKSGATTLVFRSDTTKILNYCSYNNNAKTGNLSIPNTVASIGTHAFHTCIGLTGTLTIGTGTLTIGAYSFYNTKFGGTITIPNNVTSIGTNGFQSCNVATTLTVGTGVTELKEDVFASMSALTSVTLSEGLITLNARCFSLSPSSSGTISLTIPDSVTTFGNTAFVSNNFSSIIISNTSSLSSIGTSCFYFSYKLTGTLNIPPSLTTISGEGGLTGVNFTAITGGSTNYPVEDNVIYDCKAAGLIKALVGARSYSGTLTLKAGTTSIETSCFNNSVRTGTLTILSTVTSIGASAFSGCSLFTRVDSYPATAPTVGANGLLFGGTARPLHVLTGGGTGYGVAPWITAAIFTQPAIADL